MIIELSGDEYARLVDILEATEDEGPSGEGWKSSELKALIEKIRAAVQPSADALDAARYRWLRDSRTAEVRIQEPPGKTACLPSETVWDLFNGKELDSIIDTDRAATPPAPSSPRTA